jgi:endonuclease YncB( thermonuclease family)
MGKVTEGEAREAKRGLWQQQQAIPPWEWLHWRESVRLLA